MSRILVYPSQSKLLNCSALKPACFRVWDKVDRFTGL
jgi:hypothetical protein